MQSLPVQRPSKAGRCLSTVHRAAQLLHHDRPVKRADAETETTKRQQTDKNKEKQPLEQHRFAMLILVLAQAVLCLHYKYLQIVPLIKPRVAAQN